ESSVRLGVWRALGSGLDRCRAGITARMPGGALPVKAQAAEVLPGMEVLRIRLRHGLADLPAFEQGVRRIVDPGAGQVHPGSDIQTAADKAQRSIHLEAIALVTFGGLAAVAALLVVGRRWAARCAS